MALNTEKKKKNNRKSNGIKADYFKKNNEIDKLFSQIDWQKIIRGYKLLITEIK